VTAFTDAITAAQNVYDDSGATQADVNTADANLKTFTTTFNNQKTPGAKQQSYFDTLKTVSELTSLSGYKYAVVKNGTSLPNLESSVVDKVVDGIIDLVNLDRSTFDKLVALNMTFRIIIDDSEWDGSYDNVDKNFVVDSDGIIHVGRAYLLDEWIASGDVRGFLGRYLDTIPDPE
jgi:hypothetical protein